MREVKVINSANIDRAVVVLAEAFQNDPLTRYFVLSHYNLPNSTDTGFEIQTQWFTELLHSAVEQGALLLETRGISGVAVWYPPDKPPQSIAQSDNVSDGIAEYSRVTDAAKARYLKGRQYWYLFLIGRVPSCRKGGVAPALIRPVLDQASQAGIPVWLEAATPHSRDIFKHLGFSIVAEMRVGAGKANDDGDLSDRGQGVPIWGMVQEPSLQQ